MPTPQPNPSARRRGIRLILLAALLLAGLLGALAFAGRGEQGGGDRPIGLFTTLPILWQEAPAVSDLLNTDAPAHWVRSVLQERGPVQPLDTLTNAEGTLPLARDALLVMAQPRPLSPQENVALDDWVRAGGKLLLFADPLLTGHSLYSIGDKRRPQDVVLLSPILARWGLELQFDDEQPAGLRGIELLGGTMPVDLAGRFAGMQGGNCTLAGGGLLARCRIGKGEVLAVADAALLEDAAPPDLDARRAMLGRLIATLTQD